MSSGLKKTKVKSQPVFINFYIVIFSQKTVKKRVLLHVVEVAVKKPWFLYHLFRGYTISVFNIKNKKKETK